MATCWRMAPNSLPQWTKRWLKPKLPQELLKQIWHAHFGWVPLGLLVPYQEMPKKLELPTSPHICKTFTHSAMQIKGVNMFNEFDHFKTYNKEPINKHGLYVVKLRKLSQSATDPWTYATVNFCNSGRQAINYKSCSTRSHRLFEPAITEKSLKSRGLHPSTKTRNHTST